MHSATTKITYSEYLILIAFPWKQWLREHTSMYVLHCIDIGLSCGFRDRCDHKKTAPLMCLLVAKQLTLMHVFVCVWWSHGVNGPECAKHVRNLDVNDVRMEMYFEVFTANAARNKQRTHLTFK